MKYYGRTSVEKHSVSDSKGEGYAAGRGLSEITADEYLLLREFDVMSQSDRLAAIFAGMRQLQESEVNGGNGSK